MVSQSLKEFFPHAVVRQGQAALIQDIDTALTEGEVLLAHAPTGLGKTASALAVAVKHALEHKKRVFFLTNRHTQHKIAVETLQLIKEKTGRDISCVDLIGKRWMCNQSVAGLFGNEFNEYCKTVVEKGECEFYNNVRTKKGISVEAQSVVRNLQQQGPCHNEHLVALGAEKKMCSYELALALAKQATVLIGDYYYLFNPFVQSTLFNKMDIALEDVIVVVDEGHNLPGRVMDMLSSNLTTNMLKNAILEAKKFHYSGLIHWLQEIMRVLTELASFSDQQEKEKRVTRERFFHAVNAIQPYEELINEMELAADEVRKKQRKSYLGGITAFLEAWQGEDASYTRIISERSSNYGSIITLSYTCLDPALITKDVFAQLHASIIMSGTLKPMSMYADVLGITQKLEREYASPFPPENKLSLVVPKTSTKYSIRGDVMYKRIAEECQTMTCLIPGNVALFFPSYHLRDKVAQFIQSDKKLFWEKSSMTKEEKEALLREFEQEKKRGGILLGVTGANFAEGVDFPGDLLQGVVVIGVPLAKPDLKTREIIRYYDEKFGKGWDYGYTFPAMNKCLQSAGRCIRSGTDKGAIIFLDERFAWQKYYDCFPREGLIVSKEYEKFLQEFFG